MMSGKKPTELATKTFDIALILHADHEFNASTFAARVTAATLSDLHSAAVSGIGALKGPLHGGANEQVMLMVEKIKDPAKAEAWIRKAIADKMRIMGFGHRVYRVEDPRAKHLRRLALELGRQAGSTAKVEILETVARVVSAEKHIFPNVDLFSGAAYASMGIPTDQFTPIFAMSRVAGWAAHVLEQHGNNRLIRPRARVHGRARPEVRAPRQPVGGRRAGARPARRAAVLVSVVLVVYNQLRADPRMRGKPPPHPVPFELCVVDNASSDEHRGLLPDRLAARVSPPLSAERRERGPHPRAEPGSRLATGELLCFLHNDTEMREPALAGAAARAVTGVGRGHRPGRPLRRAAAPA